MAKTKKDKPKKRPRRSRPLYVTLFFLVSFIALGAYLLTLPIWEIKEVVVNGAKMLSDQEIKGLAGIPLSENLFFTSFARARTNLSKITAIKRARFYRIPPATVLISITEREPIAAIVFPKRSVIIDRDGYIINRNTNLTINIPNMADLPVVSGIREKDILKAERVDQRVSSTVAEIISKLSPYLESGKMQLELGGLKNVSFLLDDLLRVKVGRAEQIKRKMEVFKGLLTVVEGKWAQVEYVDVRYPDNPVIRYKTK
jgi:cell division protein FtsQ